MLAISGTGTKGMGKFSQVTIAKVTALCGRISLRSFAKICALLLLLASSLPSKMAAQQDPFKRGGATKQGSESSAESSTVTGSQTADPSSRLGWPAYLRQQISTPPWFRNWQRNIQGQVSSTALKMKQSSWRESWYFYVLGLMLATVFGFLHIAGPGHGKVFTISYFMSRQATLKEGLWLSALINLVDSLSAGLVVFLTYGILSLTFHQSQWVEAIVSILSYGIIVVWGIWHLLSHLIGGHNHQHCHRCRHSSATVSGKPNDHTDHHHGDHVTESNKTTELKVAGETKMARPAWYFALGIGLVPCPISTALLIFGLLNQMLGVAIFLVVGVSLGGMVAMTLFSFAVIASKKGVSNMLLSVIQLNRAKQGPAVGEFAKPRADKGKLFEVLSEGVEILALVLMVVVGLLLLLLSVPT